MKKLTLMLLSSLLLSCEKKELPAMKHEAGETQVTQVDLGSDYRYQVWYSLAENRVVQRHLKTSWDLAFESKAEGFHVMINGSCAMRVYNTGKTEMNQVMDTVGLAVNGRADAPSGNLDSTAIGNWTEEKFVYLVNLGYDELGQARGIYKIQFRSVDASGYRFVYSALAAGPVKEGYIPKHPERNFDAFSLIRGEPVNDLEPGKNDFDMCFTNYTHVFMEPFMYYQVTGVLINSSNIRVARVSDKSFQSVVLSDTLHRIFNTDRNAIGYDWKKFDLNSNLYEVDPSISYLLLDQHGYCYKLHFVDFYTGQGLKGAPKFEYQRL